MNADRPNAISFVRTVLTASAAAARSLSRTASIIRPSRLRRSQATPATHRISTTRQTMAYRNGWMMPSREYPKIDGDWMLIPLKPPVRLASLKTSESTATAAPRVMTARFTPRTRSAGRPRITPPIPVARPATMIENGNGMPRSSANREQKKAPSPANVICASEICPTYPVSTTSDSATMAEIRPIEIAVW